MTNPLRIFIAYARKDTSYLDELRIHLRPLSRSNKIHIWYDGEIEPGEVWEAAIKKHLHEADIILLMVSPDSLNSDYFYDKEMADALERHHKGQATVVPFIIRPCGWRLTPLATLQAIPKDGKALSRWLDRDHAYTDAVTVLGELIEKRLAERRSETERKIREQKEAAELQRWKEQEALAAKNEADRLQKQKEQQDKEAKIRQQYEEKWRRRKEIAIKLEKAKRDELISNLKSPWAWGSILSLMLIFVLFKMCSLPNSPTDDLKPTQNSKHKSGFEMVDVKGGTFTMGYAGGEDDECPHQVTISDFKIGKYELTQADWRAVMGKDPAELRFKGCNDCPVERVSWNDVQDFIKKASVKYNIQYRLPTEEEWEYAARGGHNSKANYTYAGGNIINDVAWYYKNSGDKTHPVGEKKENELGIYDMSGNVWEWCSSNYRAYPNCSAKACTECKVVRGGSWYFDYDYCEVEGRHMYYPNYDYDNLGFRLASD